MKTVSVALGLILILQDKDPEKAKVSLDCKDMAIADILTQIQEKTGIPVTMDETAREHLDPSTKVSFTVRDISLHTALVLLFKPHYLTVRLLKKKGFLITVQY